MRYFDKTKYLNEVTWQYIVHVDPSVICTKYSIFILFILLIFKQVVKWIKNKIKLAQNIVGREIKNTFRAVLGKQIKK